MRIAAAAICFAAVLGSVLFPNLLRGNFQTQAGSDLLALTAEFSLGAAGALAAVLMVTLIAGRLYCSTVCPLGILQDLLGWLRFRKYRDMPWKRKVRGPVFWLVAGAAACGFLLPLTFLLPSANFVLIVNSVLRPFLPEPVALTPVPAARVAGWAVLLALLALVQWNGRIFCNTLCPLGAVLSAAAKPAYFRIAIDGEACVHCGACERACKAGCIDARAGVVRHDECVMCLNCLGVCPKNAIRLRHVPLEKAAFRADRRVFLAEGAAAVAGLTLGSAAKRFPGGGGAASAPIMPPGAVSHDRFAAHCVGCGLCIGACSGKVLKASVTEYGLRGFMQPVLDPYRGACDFSCNKCSQVCPCGALRPLTLAEKRTTRIGLAHWTASRCVAYDAEEDCGACAEHCPVGALEMVELSGKAALVPKVNEALCIGCGACQNICPIRPEAAIVVRGVERQVRVEPPKAAAPEKRLQAEEDFPF